MDRGGASRRDQRQQLALVSRRSPPVHPFNALFMLYVYTVLRWDGN